MSKSFLFYLHDAMKICVFVQELSSENKHLARLFYIFNLVRVTGIRFSVDHFITYPCRKACSEEQ